MNGWIYLLQNLKKKLNNIDEDKKNKVQLWLGSLKDKKSTLYKKYFVKCYLVIILFHMS